jgi:hypothetical protein
MSAAQPAWLSTGSTERPITLTVGKSWLRRSPSRCHSVWSSFVHLYNDADLVPTGKLPEIE